MKDIKHDPNRVGDLAEHYAITIKLIDVKSYKDGRLSAKTPLQKELKVQYLHYNSESRKCRFVNHRI